MQINQKIVLLMIAATIGSLAMSTAAPPLSPAVPTLLTNSTGMIAPIVATGVIINSLEHPLSIASPSEDIFVDRARMGLVAYKEENTSMHIEYFDTPFERLYPEKDIEHMIFMSTRDTRNIIRPYHYHRFQLPNSTTFRLHCKFMRNFINLGNKTWEDEYRFATNLMTYYRRLYENGDHTDLVCYFVDTANQTEANCLLRLVSDPNGKPFPVLEFSSVRRRHPKIEPKVSHYHPHNQVYCNMMEVFLNKYKSSTTQATPVLPTSTLSTMPQVNTTSVIITATASTNLTTTLKTVSRHYTMSVPIDNETALSSFVNWEVIISAFIIMFAILFLGGYLYKRKKTSHVVLDDSNIEFQVIRHYSGESRNSLNEENFV